MYYFQPVLYLLIFTFPFSHTVFHSLLSLYLRLFLGVSVHKRSSCHLEMQKCLHKCHNKKVLWIHGSIERLSKLWNLNTRGCSLQEPLATMMTSKSYKTSDVIGYLRSILEHSKPYARLKLMVVGIQGIGKTSLLGKY